MAQLEKRLGNLEKRFTLFEVFFEGDRFFGTRDPEKLKEVFSRHDQTLVQVSELRGEMTQMDKRISDLKNTVLAVGAIIIGLLVKIAFWGVP